MTDLDGHSGLNHRRYAINDETLYVAPSDKRTDYSQPPMNNFYYGVLNTGRRRYAHPALSGSLPTPWLPAIDRGKAFGDGAKERRGVVLSLRRKKGKMLRRSQADLLDPQAEEAEDDDQGEIPEGWATGDILRDGSTRPTSAIQTPARDEEEALSGRGGRRRMSGSATTASSSSNANPWRDPTPSASLTPRASRQRSYDPASGIIALPDEGNVWDDSGSEGEDGEHDQRGEPESPVCPPYCLLCMPARADIADHILPSSRKTQDAFGQFGGSWSFCAHCRSVRVAVAASTCIDRLSLCSTCPCIHTLRAILE